MATHTLQRPLKINISADRMTATLRASPDEDYTAVLAADILQTLESAKVKVTDEVNERAATVVEILHGANVPAEDVLLAEGRPPTEPQDAVFIFNDSETLGSVDDDPDDAADGDAHAPDLEAVNFFEQCRIRTVAAGDAIGTLTPTVRGQSGSDVLGNVVAPKRRPLDIELGDNVKLDDDGKTVRALVDGKVHFAARRLTVLPVVEIKGNIDFETGSVKAETDILVHGDVQTGFHVRSKKNVSVNGVVEGAEIAAGGDVQVRGGIAGHGKGVVKARAQLVARFCNEANLDAAGEMIIHKEIINSHVRTGGFLRMARGALIGGFAYAMRGAEVKSLGSDANIKTVVAIGLDPGILDQCDEIDQEIDKLRAATERIRESIPPLLNNLKRLSAEQRERATELMYRADELGNEAANLEKKKEQLIRDGTPEEPPFLHVSGCVFPGVTVILGNRMTAFTKEFKGPVRIERRLVDRVTEIVAVNSLTGNVSVLPSRDSRMPLD
jgi:uncharacterized protein (DUF342 family)